MMATSTAAQSMPKQRESTWFTASGIVLVTTLMMAPLAFGAVQTWAWTSLIGLSAISLMLWAFGSGATGRVHVELSAIHIVLLLAVALVSWQLVIGKTYDSIGTREALVKLIGYCIVFLLAGQLSSGLSRRSWRWLGYAIIVYLFAIALFALLQFFSNAELIYWAIKPRWGGYVFGPYVNHNHYAGLLEVLLPLGIGSILALPEHHAFRLIGAFSVLIALASVLLSGSRGGTIAVIAELAIFFVIVVRRPGLETRRGPILVALALAVLVSILFTRVGFHANAARASRDRRWRRRL